ncbi:hypothetical protein Tco_0908814 [Tanacetum coccineum]|uniref:Uncharacterized protein n=1 Tax=Tanacetum coccineum TaxID=301880 RepID=A0ABQ5CUR3_9ASTR
MQSGKRSTKELMLGSDAKSDGVRVGDRVMLKVMPLEGNSLLTIKLQFVEEPLKIMIGRFKRLKRSRIHCTSN